jgi:RNA polymerase sigma-70 factor (ECF subfamily)
MVEELLVQALRENDRSAFDVVYDQHRPRIFGWLLRMTSDRATAEELLQETFLRLARHATRLRPDTNLRAWLFTVARNLVRSRRRWAWLDSSRLLAWSETPKHRSPTPEDLAGATEMQRRLEAALADLSATSREVVLLVVYEGLEPNEAAEVLGIRPDALRQRLARARAQLTDLLGEEP